ncbi:hypothetical protein BgiMline_023994, partial [Biomphalaria glabrata]
AAEQNARFGAATGQLSKMLALALQQGSWERCSLWRCYRAAEQETGFGVATWKLGEMLALALLQGS